MLEGLSGPSIERASAHLECARGYLNRGLWELELSHYEGAEAALEGCAGAEFVMPAILFNRAETLMNWCTFLRERGRHALPAERVAAAAPRWPRRTWTCCLTPGARNCGSSARCWTRPSTRR